MARWKKLGIGIVAVAIPILVLVAVMSYWARHSMAPAREFEANSPAAAPAKVLIATQGSAFKDSIVAGVVAHLQPRSVYVKVIDVAGLPRVQEADWDAIVVIHTWELDEPQSDAQKFISRARDLRKVIILSTSGKGTFKMEDGDAISAASEMIDVPRRVAAIDARIDILLNKKSRVSAR